MNTFFVQPKNPQKVLNKIKEQSEEDSYLTIGEVIPIIREKLKRPYFNTNSLVLLTHTEKLGIYAGVTSLISFIVTNDDPEFANDPYDLEAVTPYVVKAAKWYDIKKPIPKGFNYHDNGIIAALHTFDENSCEWLISRKELECFIECEKMISLRHWESVESGQKKIGKFWYFVAKHWCNSEIKKLPPYSDILAWLSSGENFELVEKFPITEVDPINETIAIEGLLTTHAKKSWNELRDKVEKIIK